MVKKDDRIKIVKEFIARELFLNKDLKCSALIFRWSVRVHWI